jgi:amino acid transporter
MKFGTPHVSIWTIGSAMVLLVLLADLTSIVVVSTFALLFWYVLVNAAALRLKQQEMKRMGLLPMLGLAACSMLLIVVLFIAPAAWIAGVVCLVIGGIFYGIRTRFQDRRHLTK